MNVCLVSFYPFLVHSETCCPEEAVTCRINSKITSHKQRGWDVADQTAIDSSIAVSLVYLRITHRSKEL